MCSTSTVDNLGLWVGDDDYGYSNYPNQLNINRRAELGFLNIGPKLLRNRPTVFTTGILP